MRAFLRSTIVLLGVGGLVGCADKNYAPFGDTIYFNVDISGRKSASAGASDSSGLVSVCLWDSTQKEAGKECGFRIPNAELEQDWDDFSMQGDNIDATELQCHVDYGMYNGGNGLVSGDCKASIPAAKPGWSFDFIVNEMTFASVTMPKRPEITSPADQSTFSVSSGKELVMTWPASGLTDSMSWHLWPADLASGNPCFETTLWNSNATGPLTDTGSFTLPSDALPSHLPPEGCAGVLELTVEHKGPTSRGDSMGATLARETSFTLVTFMP